MKRALIVGTGTLAGVAVVLGLNPEPAPLLASASTVQSTVGGSGTAEPGTATPDGADPGSSSPGPGSSTVTGPAIDVGHGYGEAQVGITVADGRLVDITALAVPANDPHSEMISRRAWPLLVEQALAAQSADIAGVSGATYTSSGFAASLRAALQEAGLA